MMSFAVFFVEQTFKFPVEDARTLVWCHANKFLGNQSVQDVAGGRTLSVIIGYSYQSRYSVPQGDIEIILLVASFQTLVIHLSS